MGDSADFSEGLCGCFDDLVGCIVDGMICGSCSSAKQLATLEGKQAGIVDYILFYIFSPCCNYKTRGAIRAKYGYGQASFVGDCIIASWICGVCGVSQQIREMKKKGDKPCQMLLGD